MVTLALALALLCVRAPRGAPRHPNPTKRTPLPPSRSPLDETLRKLRDSLPPGWRLLRLADRVVLERTTPLWVLWQNNINAPPSRESADQRRRRIIANGRRSTCKISVDSRARRFLATARP